ncbi:MAG: two-component regulator propeller domain-containing protein [Saprospiraceae bacterium]
MRWIRWFLLLLLWSIYSGSVLSQHLFFRTYENDGADRLQEPSCLLQTSDGAIWIGDEQGLWYFDGQQFVFQAVSDSLVGRRVTALMEDRMGRLWIGYAHGAIYQRVPGSLPTPWLPEEGWPAASITGFALDKEQNLWWSTYGEGVYCSKGGYVYQFGIDDGLPAKDIYTIKSDALHRIVVAHDKGISYLGWKNGQKKDLRHFTKANGLPDDIIRTLLPGGDGGCWVGGYEGGVAYFHPDKQQASLLPASWPGGTVVGMVDFGQADLWVATTNKGLLHWRSDIQAWDTNEVTNWSNTHIQHFSADAEGNFWILCRNKGIASANRRITLQSIDIPSPQCISASDQWVWIGTTEGLFRYEPQYETIQHLVKDANIISMYNDAAGRLWLGTFGQGCLLFDPSTLSVARLGESEGLSNGNILSITSNGKDIWLATLGGVYQTSISNNDHAHSKPVFKHLSHIPSLGQSFIYCTLTDDYQRTWFGSDGKGLSVLYPNGQAEQFMHRVDSSIVKTVYSIASDHSGTIWASTDAGEVLFLQDGVFHSAPFTSSHHAGSFISLATDASGYLLMIHARGIDFWDSENKEIIHFNGAVGLDGFKPPLNGISQPLNQENWILSEKQLVRYHSLNGNFRQSSITTITGVSIFMQPIAFRQQNKFRHNENNLVISFTGFWFTDPDDISYRYILEGFDRDWIYTEDQQVVYSNLPPGTYHFQVQSASNGFFENASTDEYTFTIAKPLWQRFWFVFLIGSMALAIVWQLLKRREQRMQREASLVKEKIESQFQALKSQINPHFLFNSFNTLVSLIEDKPTDAVKYVEKLSDFYRNILQYRESDLVELQTEMQLVQDFCYLLEHRYGNNLRIIYPSTPTKGWMIVPFALQILVENAVKHNVISKTQPLSVQISVDEDDYIWVANPIQPKLTQETSTGFGIASIRKRYSLLTNTPILVDKTPAFFKVGIPLLKTHSL